MTTPLEPELLEEVRLAVFRCLADTGRLPDAGELERLVGGADQLAHAVAALADARWWALEDGHIALAHPFATRSFGFSVMSDTTLWWGGCCWDAFAITHLVDGVPTIVASSCPACDRPLAWRVDGQRPPEGPERAHFLVPMERAWDDVLHTCANQLLFCDDACIDTWLARHGHAEGSRLDLDALWRLAAGWYDGRLDRDHRRREPAEAADHFRRAGLSGRFWGLADDGD